MLKSPFLYGAMSESGTLEPVDVALQEAALETKLSVGWVATSVVETRIAVTGNRSGNPRFPAFRAPPQGCLFA